MIDLFSEMDQLGNENVLHAPFGWPGGKSESLKIILPKLPYRRGYCSVFGGSGCDLLARNESYLEIYNDRYGGVTAFYRCIRDNHDALIKRLEQCLHSKEEFIWCRDTWENCDDLVERAARWYYMVNTSFGQMGRNWGRAIKNRGLFGIKLHNSLKDFTALHLRLLNVQIDNLDWYDCITQYDSSEMVFFNDPPYLGTDNTGAYGLKWTSNDQLALCELIMRSKGFHCLCGYENGACDRINDMYEWDDRIIYSGLTTINGAPSVAREVLWIKESA